MKTEFLLPVLALSAFLFSAPAHAATRTVYFDQTAVNTSVNGFSSTATAKCTILLNNPSAYGQTITMKVYATATGTGAGNATATGFTGSNPLELSSTSLASGTQLKYDIVYPVFPANTASVQQRLFCRGEITATDTADATPGFVVANGVLLTFSEASAMQTIATSGGAREVFKGNLVYTQIPLTINRGKPF